MPSSYTPSLKLTLPATGELVGTWGTVVNSGVTSLVDQAIAGTTTITMTANINYTLSNLNGQSDEARSMFIDVQGGPHTGTVNVICPAVSKMYFVTNNTSGDQAIVFKTASGTGVTILPTQRIALYCDGTNVYNLANAPKEFLYVNGIYANGLDTPSAPTGTPSTSGGSLASATYYIKIQALDALGGGTPVSSQTSFVVTGPTGKISLSWAAVQGATTYAVWIGTSSNGQDKYFDGITTNSYELTTVTGATASAITGGPAWTTVYSGVFQGNVGVASGNLDISNVFNTVQGAFGLSLSSIATGASSYIQIKIDNDTLADALSLRVYPSTYATPSWVKFYSTAPKVSFYANSTEVFYLDSSGNMKKPSAGDIESTSTGRILSSGSGAIQSSGSGKILSSGTGNIESSGSGNIYTTGSGRIGYGNGAGGSVTQTTSKATAVTINKATGLITTSNAALGAGASVTFTVNNTYAVGTSAILINTVANANYTVQVSVINAGSFDVKLTNITAGSLSQAVGIQFIIINGAWS